MDSSCKKGYYNAQRYTTHEMHTWRENLIKPFQKHFGTINL